MSRLLLSIALVLTLAGCASSPAPTPHGLPPVEYETVPMITTITNR